MSRQRVYLDTGVFLAAFRGEGSAAEAALMIIGDPSRLIVVSEYVFLELFPKPTYFKREDELEFMRSALDDAEVVSSSVEIRRQAMDFACRYGLNAIDALHVSAGFGARVEAVVTTEKPTKPIFRVAELRVLPLLPETR